MRIAYRMLTAYDGRENRHCVFKNIEASGPNCLLIQPIPPVDYPVLYKDNIILISLNLTVMYATFSEVTKIVSPAIALHAV